MKQKYPDDFILLTYKLKALNKLSKMKTSYFLQITDSDTYYNVTAVIERRIRVEKLAEFVCKKTKEDFKEEFAVNVFVKYCLRFYTTATNINA